MMRLIHGLAVLAALSALAAVPASAQISGANNQITFKAGVFSPVKGPVKDVSSNWWIGGAEYALGDPNAPKVNSLEALYSSKGSTITSLDKEGIPTHYKVLSLMLNHRIRNVKSGSVVLGDLLYYGAGVGAHIVELKVDDPNPSGEGSIDKKQTVPGANVFIGYELGSNLQIEAKYQFAFKKVEDRDISGLQFLVGIKF